MDYFGLKLGDIKDEEILLLFDELRQITSVDPTDYEDVLLHNFLMQCFYPAGGQKLIKLNKARINYVDEYGDFLILGKVGKVGSSLLQLFINITDQRGEHIENYNGSSIYMFLNKMYAPIKKKRNPRMPY